MEKDFEERVITIIEQYVGQHHYSSNVTQDGKEKCSSPEPKWKDEVPTLSHADAEDMRAIVAGCFGFTTTIETSLKAVLDPSEMPELPPCSDPTERALRDMLCELRARLHSLSGRIHPI